MQVSGLLAYDGGDDSGDATQLDVDDVVDRLATNATGIEMDLTGWFHGKMDEPGLLGWGDKGKPGFRRGGKDVKEQDGRQTVGEVGWEFEVVLMSFPVLGVRCNLTRSRVDRDVDGLGK